MRIERIKTLLLIFLVVLSMFFTSKIWLQPQRSNKTVGISNEGIEKIYLWDKIKPEKIIIFEEDKYITYKEDFCDIAWNETLIVFSEMLKDSSASITEINKNKNKGIEISFSNAIPSEIFIKGFDIPNSDFYDAVKHIENIYIPIDDQSIIFETRYGENFEVVSSNINKSKIIEVYNNFLEKLEFNEEVVIKDIEVDIPFPVNEVIMNPVIVKSEINIEDEEYITEIAQTYYNENYDYVRKSVENNSSVNYVYKNEKVLKINNDGLLEFYDTTEETISENEIYKSLLIALNFIENFLGFPENAYLAQFQNTQRDGNYGFEFIFDYKVLNRPIIFSQVRNERAIEIEVVGDKVVSYRRFIRDIDYSENSKMKETKAMNAKNVLENNIELLTQIYKEENELEIDENKKEVENDEDKKIEEQIISSIEEIYLGYYDPSRKLSDQLIRSVWVVKTNEEKYIFNAITGRLIEIQKIN